MMVRRRATALETGMVAADRRARACQARLIASRRYCPALFSTVRSGSSGPSSPFASGFSLLELVIALAMMAVLASYGIPAYVSYAARGHRIDAVVALYQAAQHVTAHAAASVSGGTLPPELSRTPAQGHAVYRLQLVWFDDREGSYEIQAIPVDDGPMAGDACGTFVLDGLGTRSNRMARGEDAAFNACWLGRAP